MKLTKSSTCEALGISASTLNVYIDQGLVCEKEGKSYAIDLSVAVAWYLDYKTKKIQTKLDELQEDHHVDYDKEYRKYKSIRMKLEAHKESMNLITIGEAEQAMLVRLIQIREALKQIPLSWPNRIIGLEDQQESQDLLDELLQELLTQLSEQPDEIDYNTVGVDIKDDVDIEDTEDIKNIH